MSILAVLIGLLGLLMLLVTVAGVVAPNTFKDKKTGEIPKRIELLIGGLLIAGIAFIVAAWIAPEDAPSEVVQEVKPQASTPSSLAAPPASADKPDTPEPKKPLDLAEARLFAEGTLQVINEAEESLMDGIQLGDQSGITRHVWRPLVEELGRWPTMIERQPDDHRQHFSYCQTAAMTLQQLSAIVTHERTVDSMKYVRQGEARYHKEKQKCEQQLEATDSQIKAAIAAEDAELQRKFGGRDCLTVFEVDKQTGEMVDKPKPAHCKTPARAL
ncbi:hypothetical protein D5041_07810 [Verminephrobacter aporrectodeae subsp. tuberculatae]|uniref:hypothetical protein n=1 Tax=Verminephrobacter aporrectodeae TaxID=1110389 RepID=UPI002237116B|nr:hypothetical protein [Verminephrobacter aporrectodeae]MCW5223503.1 hypothetical protein [Verminephrobacter aporrectodeae subsp. tuberculatae]MCW5288968.1 hypothetical protein [Verminephrobacter aporrectodeae subsp. tuberculatae]